MRSPDRIDKILADLHKVWHKYPDLRFYQLVINTMRRNYDEYYTEDDVMLKRLTKTYPEVFNSTHLQEG